MRKAYKWRRYAPYNPKRPLIESPFPSWDEMKQYAGQWVVILDHAIIDHAYHPRDLKRIGDGALYQVPEPGVMFFYMAS